MHRAAAVSLALALAGGGVALGTSCSKAPDAVPTPDAATEAAIAELRREVQAMKEERDSALRATGVSGAEHRTLVQAVGDLRDELKRVQAELAAVPKTAAPASTGSSDPGPGARYPAPFAANNDGTYPEEVVTSFGKIYDELLRRRDEEQQRDRLRKGLAQAGVTLTADEEAALMRLQKSFQEKRQELFSGMRGAGAPTDADQQVMRTKMEELRTQFESDIRASVPTAQADKIVEAMKRNYPGFFPRPDRGDRSMRPGMGG